MSKTLAVALLGATVLASCGASEAVGNADYPSAEEFAADADVGNIYSCVTRSGPPIFVIIGAIDDFTKPITAYSVQIIPAVEGLPTVGHAPFAAESFAYCLPEDPVEMRALEVRFDNEYFDDGYRTWKEANGGVFTIEITQIYATMGALAGEGS